MNNSKRIIYQLESKSCHFFQVILSASDIFIHLTYKSDHYAVNKVVQLRCTSFTEKPVDVQ